MVKIIITSFCLWISYGSNVWNIY